MKKVFKILKRTMQILLILIVFIGAVTFLYMRQAKFGQLPAGERLARIEKSPHYKDGHFLNLIEKPTLTPGYSMLGELYKTIFKKYPNREPLDSLPSVKTDLKNLPIDSNLIVWFGHSSFYMQLDGKRFLADPVFSESASPVPGSVKAYKGSNIYEADDMPEIDYMLISHDHYDHLDYKTAIALKNKVKHVVCGLGVGAHFEYWGYRPEQLIEKDWYEKVEVAPGYTIFTESTHHDCGRGFRPGKALWLSFLIQSPAMKVYYSGDGGYDNRFAEIGHKYGPVDWAIMECGQYNKAWQSVHELPEEVALATVQLKAKNMIPVHHSKFTLANHPWDEPLNKITEFSIHKPYRLATPMIGEAVSLNDPAQTFTKWWKGVN
ncbi:L-ascorbate metabolism protein UlaG (beta-lactamase superfamily) [Pedobacter cryoconitis]|uniref:MBL fold metallo-hydrolase n=1 Tax=Pedobacter cryoconitis TaxID=188932 RepID=UPI00182E3BC5|nr:MBL fold metallo-hydrolase [Pedobacter cryoconitis]MBB6269728.1 L-ascorbate metabolism protein UlaG (beta-lactamase superfamily) [Pedobacter cryoconitis]